MGWAAWANIGIWAVNVLFFGALAVVWLIERWRDRK